MKTLLFGIAWVVGAYCFWLYLAGNPVDELALIRRAQVAPGFIVDTWEEPEDGDDGRTHWFHGATYTYRLPDGRKFTGSAHGSGRLNLEPPYPVEVEYLPDHPSVSRIRGSGSSSITDWLWRKIGLGSLLLALLVSPGVAMVRAGIREMRNGGSHNDGDNRDERP